MPLNQPLRYLASSKARSATAGFATFFFLLLLISNTFRTREVLITAPVPTNFAPGQSIGISLFELHIFIGGLSVTEIGIGWKAESAASTDAEHSQAKLIASQFLSSIGRRPIRDDAVIYNSVRLGQLILPIAFGLAVFVLLRRLSSKVRTDGLCRKCGYCVVGINILVCPECGHPIDS
jgi:hypothetical protein